MPLVLRTLVHVLLTTFYLMLNHFFKVIHKNMLTFSAPLSHLKDASIGADCFLRNYMQICICKSIMIKKVTKHITKLALEIY